MADIAGAGRIRNTERILLGIGVTLLGGWAVARLDGVFASRASVARFQEQAPELRISEASSSQFFDPMLSTMIDLRLWSDKRIAAYKDSIARQNEVPRAILRISKINLEVPVFNDTDEVTLNRGVGRIHGTAQFGQPGNLGIAGHRDGFFRGLRDIAAGDVLELHLRDRRNQYVVENIHIVTPDDTSVLAPTAEPTLTLVTCFPFYYVGSAPQRYIVTASFRNSSQGN
jgi:sortase A